VQDLKLKLNLSLGPDADATIANCVVLPPAQIAAFVNPVWQASRLCKLPPPLSIGQRGALHSPFSPAPYDTAAAVSSMMRRAAPLAAEIQADLGRAATPLYIDAQILRRMEVGRLRLLSAEVAQGASDGILLIDATLKGTTERVIAQVVDLINDPRRSRGERSLRRGRWLYALNMALPPTEKAQATRKSNLKDERIAAHAARIAQGKAAAARARSLAAGKPVPAPIEVLSRGEPAASKKAPGKRRERGQEQGAGSNLTRLALAATSPEILPILARPDWQDALIGSCLDVEPRIIAVQCDLLARLQGEVQFPVLTTETRRALYPVVSGPLLALTGAVSLGLQADPEVVSLTGATPELLATLTGKREELVRLREGSLRLVVAATDGCALLDAGLRKAGESVLSWVDDRVAPLPEDDPRRATLLAESAAARAAKERAQDLMAARRAEAERRKKAQEEEIDAQVRHAEAIETLSRASSGEDVDPLDFAEALERYREAAAAEEEAAALAFAQGGSFAGESRGTER
jgi:hypothetical protein